MADKLPQETKDLKLHNTLIIYEGMGLITKQIENDPRQESIIKKILEDQNAKWNLSINMVGQDINQL